MTSKRRKIATWAGLLDARLVVLWIIILHLAFYNELDRDVRPIRVMVSYLDTPQDTLDSFCCLGFSTTPGLPFPFLNEMDILSSALPAILVCSCQRLPFRVDQIPGRYSPPLASWLVQCNTVQPQCARILGIQKTKARRPWNCCYLVGPAGFEPATP